jgi:hypothetical protein
MLKTLQVCKVGNISPPLAFTSYHCPSAIDLHEGIKDTSPHAEGNRAGLSPIREPEVKSTKIVHELSSPPTQGSCHKRHKGKEKESPGKKLKEYLNNLEDEMICPMSGSEQHFEEKLILTFTILDAVISCKETCL